MDKSAKLSKMLNQAAVTETELETLEAQRERVVVLANELRMVAAGLASIEANLMTRLRSGAKVKGRLTAVIASFRGRSSPKWKEELLLHLEKDHGFPRALVEAQVAARYPGVMTEKLVVGVKPGPKGVK